MQSNFFQLVNPSTSDALRNLMRSIFPSCRAQIHFQIANIPLTLLLACVAPSWATFPGTWDSSESIDGDEIVMERDEFGHIYAQPMAGANTVPPLNVVPASPPTPSPYQASPLRSTPGSPKIVPRVPRSPTSPKPIAKARPVAHWKLPATPPPPPPPPVDYSEIPSQVGNDVAGHVYSTPPPVAPRVIAANGGVAFTQLN